MSHVLIQNQGELPIWGVRLMGYSDKEAYQIGQFGTGLKEAIALLVRMGQPPIIFMGTCRTDFTVETVDDQQEICFSLSEDKPRFPANIPHPLGIHPNMGCKDWDDPWMAFREIICNALDASGTENLVHDIVSTSPEGIAGSTRVYVPTSSAILEAYLSVHHKLLCLDTYEVVLPITGVGRLIEKRKQKKLQVYCKGVWVQESHESSFFDYELDIKLNESRSADWHTVNSSVSKIISLFSKNQCVRVLEYMLNDEKQSDMSECDRLATASHYLSATDDQSWSAAFDTLFGNKAVLVENDKFFVDRVESAGYKPVVVEHDGLRSLLKAAGVKTPMTILTADARAYERTMGPSDETRQMFERVWAWFDSRGLNHGRTMPGLVCFKQRPSNEVKFGEYSNNTVYLNIDMQGSFTEVMACVEEIVHHCSGAADYHKDMQHFLVETLAREIDNDIKETSNGHETSTTD